MRDVLVFGCVLLLAWWASRALGRLGRGGVGGGSFALLGALSLGNGRQICAVHVGRRVLILGLADKGVTLLDAIRDPDEVALLLPPAGEGGPGAGGPFARTFAEMMARRRGPGGSSHA